MNWYKIGQRTAARSVSWLNTTRSPFSTKFGFPYTLTVSGSNLFPLFRQLLIPCNRTIAVTINVKCIHVSHCVSYSNESDSDGEEISEEVMDLYNEPDMHSLRNLLYTDFDNPLMKQLNEASSVQDVFNFIKQHESDMDEQLTSQSVLILWDLQKIFYNVNALNLHPNPVISALLNPHEVVKNYVSEVNGHEDFELLLSLVDKWYKDMSVEALTATVLYLNKMGVGLGSPIVQKLISHCEDMLEMFGSRFPLTSLSRFTVVVCSRHDLWPILVCKNAVPHIFNSIDLCENADDFRLLTICLTNIRQLVSFSILHRYKCKVEQLIDNETITAKDSKVICKIVRFLNYPHWSSYNCSTIRKTILLLKGHIKEMLPQDLIILHKVYQSQLEPADIIDEMHEAATEFLSQAKNATIGSSPLAVQGTTDLLDCLVSFSSPEQKTMLEKLALHHVESCSANNLPTLFRILRQLKTSNIQLCNAFWSKTLQLMKALPSERVDYKLFRVAHRYMYFNNNLGGTYRHYDLEKYLIHWLWNEAVDKNACLIPSKFSRIASFILAYGNIGQNRPVITEPIVTQLVQKILDLTPQFSKIDCLYISRGLKIGASLGHQKRNPSQHFLDAFTKIETALNNDAIEKLNRSDLKLSDVNKLMNAYVSRGRIEDSGLYEQILQRYEDVGTIYSSRDLREAATNLLSTSSLVPGALDCMVQYVIENGAHLTGDTLLRLLYTCYVLGYTPTQAEDFFPLASSIVIRDRERLQGLIILQAAIALCFFHQLPEELLHFIFTVNFLERLDEEVHNCYAKATYPMRVRYAMMHLNRAVCLDYPETDVPWFHEKYCQQTAVMESQLLTPLKKDVHQSLVSVLGAENLISVKKYSPYFYNIDFQVLLNKNREPVSIKQEADTGITKIAFLVWAKNAYTNGVTQLCGEQQLKQRHLEMLGYRVVGISSSLWNSMYMAEPKAKVDYLRDKIWPSTVDCKSQKSCGLS